MTPDNTASNSHAGIYIHFPFCVHKCPYCDFYSITDLSLTRMFLSSLKKEMEMIQDFPFACDTIYFGGGTPSILEAQEISQILETINRFFKIQTNPEITIEVNPGTVDLDKLKLYKTAGVNRVNIGVQSFKDSHLKFLGRIHNSNDAKSIFNQARNSGFDNIGLDLMYGLPGQSKDSWLMDLQTAIDLKPEHLSCYMLTYEKNTAMYKMMENKSFHTLPEKHVGHLFKTTMGFMEKNEYLQYEISNFAKASSEAFQNNTSKHNQKYWSSAPYLGFGPSAHSFLEPQRYWNVRSVKEYIHLLNNGNRPVEEKEVLTARQMMIEAIYLGLRKTEGIDIHTYNQKFNSTFTSQFEDVIKELKIKKLIIIDGKKCRLSRKGILFLDSIAPMFLNKIP